MSRSGPKRSQRQREQHYVEIAEMYLLGRSNQFIAESLSLSVSQVYRDLAVIEERWHQQAIAALQKYKGKELARLEMIQREAWASWQRSQEPKVIHKQEVVGSIEGGSGMVRQTTRTETAWGDPRYLDLALNAIQTEIKLLGLDKLPRNDDNNHCTVIPEDLDALSAVELSDLAHRILRG
ncbi:MAG: hypothetical protein KME35_23725 [Aphanocapsa sp. GSE-SYN-MK-11-07L]|nr:hypothetical protein [Aphanocapsa sp. GSE-SYN-MK-11-07L]